MNNLVPSTELDKFLLTEMCKDAAEGVRMQCGRKYWSDEGNQRATQIYKLSETKRKHLPTNNLNCERYLAKFGYLASKSDQKSNRFFKAKRIKDDLMFTNHSSEEMERCPANNEDFG